MAITYINFNLTFLLIAYHLKSLSECEVQSRVNLLELIVWPFSGLEKLSGNLTLLKMQFGFTTRAFMLLIKHLAQFCCVTKYISLWWELLLMSKISKLNLRWNFT